MGNLEGHVLPGTMFLVFGLWWTYNVSLRFLVAERLRFDGGRSRFRSNLTFTSGYYPLEPAFIIILTLVGIIGEAVTGFRDGVFVNYGNSQHIMMYFFFMMVGVVELLRLYKWPLPEGLEYAVAVMAAMAEVVLFSWHLHGRPDMDVQLHKLLLYTIYGCAAVTLLEMRNRDNPLPAFGRAYFACLQGTWFWQAGFILYPPGGVGTWHLGSHRQMMVVAALFTVHMAAVLLTMLLLLALLHLRVRCWPSHQVESFVKINGDERCHLYQTVGMREATSNQSLVDMEL